MDVKGSGFILPLNMEVWPDPAVLFVLASCLVGPEPSLQFLLFVTDVD